MAGWLFREVATAQVVPSPPYPTEATLISSISALRHYGLSCVVAAGLVACVASPVAAQDAADPNPGAITISGAVDFTNAYMFRGIRQEDEGFIMWPYFDLGLAVYSGDGALKSVGVNFGTWNSLHSGDTGTDGRGRLWYESDFYATLGLGFGGGFSLGTTYTAYASPNGAFSTVKEIALKASVDDSGYLGKAAIKPYVLVAFELDVESPGQGQADGGTKRGTYVEIGAAPGYSGGGVSLAFPIKVGLSASNYYESNVNGEDSKFGYFSLAGIATVPLGGTTKFGSWNIHGGVEWQRLGDTTKLFNTDDDGDPQSNKVIGSIGIGFSY